ncbi:unnamed protein product [Didymodactylos carnosus]|uniref:Uncharacterized protein n=1 Tax=Didymodactylos carnosus TaxID=1234261 RepID=A0A815FJX2_9BILA|nr:unnamed protein product [Didymodactylos carnosus]CAF1327109.1 unnamed protein product [Didymodactylos carnosus]CAF3719540.1 unnamed protein product [Didymodactylos carnosus]CAF4177594.1 unnamed protein product [Didymodactylos carnosus]
MGDIKRAAKYYEMVVSEQLADNVEVGRMYVLAGDVQVMRHNFDEALKNYEISLEIYSMSTTNECIADVYRKIGHLKHLQLDYESTVFYCNKALKNYMLQPQSDTSNSSICLTIYMLGDALRHLK